MAASVPPYAVFVQPFCVGIARSKEQPHGEDSLCAIADARIVNIRCEPLYVPQDATTTTIVAGTTVAEHSKSLTNILDSPKELLNYIGSDMIRQWSDDICRVNHGKRCFLGIHIGKLIQCVKSYLNHRGLTIDPDWVVPNGVLALELLNNPYICSNGTLNDDEYMKVCYTLQDVIRDAQETDLGLNFGCVLRELVTRLQETNETYQTSHDIISATPLSSTYHSNKETPDDTCTESQISCASCASSCGETSKQHPLTESSHYTTSQRPFKHHKNKPTSFAQRPRRTSSSSRLPFEPETLFKITVSDLLVESLSLQKTVYMDMEQAALKYGQMVFGKGSPYKHRPNRPFRTLEDLECWDDRSFTWCNVSQFVVFKYRLAHLWSQCSDIPESWSRILGTIDPIISQWNTFVTQHKAWYMCIGDYIERSKDSTKYQNTLEVESTTLESIFEAPSKNPEARKSRTPTKEKSYKNNPGSALEDSLDLRHSDHGTRSFASIKKKPMSSQVEIGHSLEPLHKSTSRPYSQQRTHEPFSMVRLRTQTQTTIPSTRK